VTGECLHVFRDHRRPLYALTFSPDGRFIATGSGDGWMHIYHTRVRFTLTFHHWLRLNIWTQTHVRVWSWYAGSDKPGIFEIDWQEEDDVNRIAMALECREVAVLDVNKIPIFHSPEFRSPIKDQLMALTKAGIIRTHPVSHDKA
jgi:transducin (beta)-like 1